MSSRVLTRLYRPIPSGKTEDPDEYKWDGLHPVHIGDNFKDARYRIIHKLRQGSFSTVWLARDEQEKEYVALKIVEAETSSPDNKELKVLLDLAQSSLDHAGRNFILHLKDDFWIEGPNGRHLCYVTQVADLYTSNILLQLANFDSWSENDIYDCVGQPVEEPVQRRDGGSIDETVPQYLVQPCNMRALEDRLSLARIMIIDFGQAFYHDETPDVLTPKQFSAPEVLFGTAITPATDQWQLGCTIFEVCSGYSLLNMLFNPKMDVMKDMVAMLGKPPDTMWQRWKERENYFEADGAPKAATGRKIAVRPYPLVDRVYDIVRSDEKIRGEQSGKMTGISNEKIRGEQSGNMTGISKKSNVAPPKLPNDQLVQLHDLLSKLMVYEPRERLPMDRALNHPFFTAVAKANSAQKYSQS
ncbi:MAG: hypothetical protein Q9163_005600 [Psora crenata]